MKVTSDNITYEYVKPFTEEKIIFFLQRF